MSSKASTKEEGVEIEKVATQQILRLELSLEAEHGMLNMSSKLK